jgi:hypothetical protein
VFCSCVKVDLKRSVFISFGNLTVHDNIWCLKVLIDVRTPKLQHVSYQLPLKLMLTWRPLSSSFIYKKKYTLYFFSCSVREIYAMSSLCLKSMGIYFFYLYLLKKQKATMVWTLDFLFEHDDSWGFTGLSIFNKFDVPSIKSKPQIYHKYRWTIFCINLLSNHINFSIEDSY